MTKHTKPDFADVLADARANPTPERVEFDINRFGSVRVLFHSGAQAVVQIADGERVLNLRGSELKVWHLIHEINAVGSEQFRQRAVEMVHEQGYRLEAQEEELESLAGQLDERRTLLKMVEAEKREYQKELRKKIGERGVELFDDKVRTVLRKQHAEWFEYH